MTQSTAFKNILIIGGSSAMAAACARVWLAQGAQQLLLWGRDSLKLERTANDLRIRAPAAHITSACVDFMNASAIKAQVDELYLTSVPDLILIAHGALIEQSQCQDSIEACAQSLTVNAVSPALFAEAFATHLEQRNRGTLAIISSVAGDRGRRSNYVYGAAKGLLNRYAQGLQHRFAGTGVNIALIKPGPTATPMTAGLLQQGQRMASAEQVAAVITTGLNNKKSVIYAPGQWRLIMMIIRHLPAFVFNRLNI